MAKMDWDRVKRENLARHAKPFKEPAPRKGHPVSGRKGIDLFGYCPTCNQVKWWDNGPAKKSGRYKPNAPDAQCANCGHTLWPKRH